MLTMRQCSLAGSLVVLSLLACDRNEPFAPNFASSRRTVLAPSNVTATAISSSQVDVAWKDNSDNEDGFEVYVAATASGTFTLWSTPGPNVTTESFSGIAGERDYCIKVRALMARGKNRTYSEFSNTACASTALPPTAPLRTDVTPQSSSSVIVGWVDNSNNETGFRVERSLDQGSTWTIVGTATWPNYLRDGGLPSEQQVCYRVIAFNGHGDSPPSSRCTALPVGPTDLTATGVAVPAVDLTWTDHSAVEDGYEVLRSSDGNSFGVAAILAPNSTVYRDIAVGANTRYWYVVRARKDNGSSDQSNAASAVAATVPPAAPSGTSVRPFGSTTTDIWWTDNSSNEEGFRIERSLDGGASWTTAGTTGASDYPWGGLVDHNLTSEQLVCYRVVAFNGMGDSPPSNAACTTPPAGPTNLTVTWIDQETLDITWTDNSAVEDGYEVGLANGEGDCAFVGLSANSTSFRYTDPTGTCSAYVGVLAIKDGGFSDSASWPPASASAAHGSARREP